MALITLMVLAIGLRLGSPGRRPRPPEPDDRVSPSLPAAIASLAAAPASMPDDQSPLPAATQQPVAERLTELTSALSAVLRGADEAAWAVDSEPRLEGTTRYLDVLPDARLIGSACHAGALVAVGTDAIAATIEGGGRAVRLYRVFARTAPVAIPAGIAVDRSAGTMLVTAAESPWPAGFYAIAQRTDAGLRVLPFCVGEVTRAVDYSLVLYVPRGTDGPAARSELVRQLRDR